RASGSCIGLARGNQREMTAYARQPPGPPPAPINPEEFARYTRELLESLRKMAIFQGQATLAHLLGWRQWRRNTLAVRPRTPDCPDGGRPGPPTPFPAKSSEAPRPERRKAG